MLQMAKDRSPPFTPEIEAETLALIAQGEPVRQICMLENFPAQSSFYRHVIASDSFRERYTRAKEDALHKMEEDILDIVDDNRNDWIERENQRTGATYVALNDEAISRSKLRIETRKWLMGKLKPKKYGEKLALGGADDLPPIKSVSAMIAPDTAYMAMLQHGTLLKDDESDLV